MNDTERELWVINDEGLYNWWRSSGVGKRRFLREYRAEIDAAINRMLHRTSVGVADHENG